MIAQMLNDPTCVSTAIVEAVKQETLQPRHLQTILRKHLQLNELILSKDAKVLEVLQSPSSDRPVHTPSSPALKVVDIPGKGKGVIALRDLKEGDLLFIEKPILTIDWENDKDLSEEEVVRKLEVQIARLSPQQREKFYSLHLATPRIHKPKPFAIFHSNAISLSNAIGVMPGRDAGGIFLEGSRFNHSCRHSVQWIWDKNVDAMKFRLVRDVGKGEEITGRYIDTLEDSETREVVLEDNYGFKCRCEVCSLPSDQLAQSNERRTKLSKMIASLKQTPSFDSIPLRDHALCVDAWRLIKEEDVRSEFEDDIAYAGMMHSIIYGYEEPARIWIEYLSRSHKRTFGPDSDRIKTSEILKIDVACHPAWKLMERFKTKHGEKK